MTLEEDARLVSVWRGVVSFWANFELAVHPMPSFFAGVSRTFAEAMLLFCDGLLLGFVLEMERVSIAWA
jgi:hypothetical protein